MSEIVKEFGQEARSRLPWAVGRAVIGIPLVAMSAMLLTPSESSQPRAPEETTVTEDFSRQTQEAIDMGTCVVHLELGANPPGADVTDAKAAVTDTKPSAACPDPQVNLPMG